MPGMEMPKIEMITRRSLRSACPLLAIGERPSSRSRAQQSRLRKTPIANVAPDGRSICARRASCACARHYRTGRVKARTRIPADLTACHTAQIAGYVIEGHVPAPSIRKLLAEKPRAKGLAVRGMPTGSPGMAIPGSPNEEYEVILFGEERRTYARYMGTKELKISWSARG